MAYMEDVLPTHLFITGTDGYCVSCNDDSYGDHFICNDCSTIEGITLLPEPYLFDIEGKKKMMWFCDPCYIQREQKVLSA